MSSGESMTDNVARLNSEFVLRPLFGILLAVMVLSAVGLGPAYFAVIVLLVSLLAAREWHRLVRTGEPEALPFHRNPFHLQTIVTTVAIAAAVVAILNYLPLVALGLLAAGTVAGFMLATSRGDNAVWQAAGVLYIGIPALSLLAMHLYPTYHGPHPLVVAGFFIIVWATDTGALIVGKIVGGAKLAPSISPGKTWSGTIGGSVIAAACYMGYVFLIGGSLWAAFLFALLFSVTAHAGDLFESFVKRRFGRKDSGRIIPGHGGVLDRVDSTFAAAPVMALLVVFAGFNPLMVELL